MGRRPPAEIGGDRAAALLVHVAVEHRCRCAAVLAPHLAPSVRLELERGHASRVRLAASGFQRRVRIGMSAPARRVPIP